MKIVILLFVILFLIIISISLYLDFTTFHRPKDGNYKFNINKNFVKLYEIQENAKQELLKKKHEELSICSFDNTKLCATYFESNPTTNETIICDHGFKSTGLGDFSYQANYLLSLGYNVLIPDNRAHGKSDGKWIGFSVLDSYDILKWCDYLIQQNPKVEIILYGQSMGAATVINSAANSSLPFNVKGLISDCSYDSGYKVMERNFKRKIKLPVDFFMIVDDLLLKLFAHYSLKDLEAKKEISKVKVPTLIIHGDKDHLVPVESAYLLYERCNADKELLIVKDADHIQSYITDTKGCQQAIQRLLKKASK